MVRWATMASENISGESRTNPMGQTIGFAVEGWRESKRPSRETMEGRLCRVEPLDPERHGASLFEANAADTEGQNWTYMPYGPFDDLASYRSWLESVSELEDPLYYAIVEQKCGRATGVASYLRIKPEVGVIEVGHINLSPRLQRTPAATEAMFLMMQNVFDLGYRRYEWKCDALNGPSRVAAQRLGFSFEGIFRQATMYKGRNRDTAWYAVIDREWPSIQSAFLRWLDPSNFDAQGRQRLRLSALTRPMLDSIG